MGRYDDRRRDDRNRDRDKRRSRKDEEVDEFGRAKTINSDYREGKYPTREDDKRGKDNRSRSRDAGKSTGSLIKDSQDCTILQIEFSEDWQEVMSQKFEEYKLSMSVWDMTCLDRKDKVLDMEA